MHFQNFKICSSTIDSIKRVNTRVMQQNDEAVINGIHSVLINNTRVTHQNDEAVINGSLTNNISVDTTYQFK